MPNKLRRLKEKARDACMWRNHSMTAFKYISKWSHKVKATCKYCGMEVCVNINPAPNEIDISGEAVAMNCRGTNRQ